ncbi:SdpI family protein [Intestinimonas massiliensis (ex Afouda et al. 2020)]|uniref:SdpI family protein n=1 Tax=Intestinimonas massiliensis (ex Afouda et al. 2020) TaxID=1673721 RepID=UPI001031D21E|nr:SdpI family protein [Intestinimonas massiliensis (ex Afouda et al. 2020)]
MGFWIFCLAMNLLLPVIMLVFGRLFQKKPPRQINGLYGYRTAWSMKSQETWNFAHKLCGRLWFRLGLILLPVSVCAMLPALGRSVDAVGIWCCVVEGVQLVVLIGSIIPVERALKRTFDDFGRKR